MKMSTFYHPQYDGQTKVINKFLETYLHSFTSEKKHHWVQWFLLVEWWYNTTYHKATKMSSYEVVYGKHPPLVTSYLPWTSKVQEVDTLLQIHVRTLVALKTNLEMAQNHMKWQVDRHHLERSFVVGDFVFLHLQPYKQTSLRD